MHEQRHERCALRQTCLADHQIHGMQCWMANSFCMTRRERMHLECNTHFRSGTLLVQEPTEKVRF